MLSRENFSEEHILELQDFYRRDPILLERTVYAFGLLEALQTVGLPFIFKGGTSLMLLLKHPQRLSTDIDIVVPPGTDVGKYIDAASKIFPFKDKSEDIRVGKNNIVKKHYKFVYDSPLKGTDFYILLDILFEENNYEKLLECEIKNDLLITEGDNLKVKIPSAESILGDKLTAFAPHTSGILIDAPNKRTLEIMKQMFDVSSLLDVCTDFTEVHRTYSSVVKTEIAYRGTEFTEYDCLEDTLDASICIASRGRLRPDDYKRYVKGIRDVRTHILGENYTPEHAILRAAKIIYLTVCMMKNVEYSHIEDYSSFLGRKLHSNKFSPLIKIRAGYPAAYAYIIKADQIYSEEDNCSI